MVENSTFGVVHILNPRDENFFPWSGVENFDPTISTLGSTPPRTIQPPCASLEVEKSTPRGIIVQPTHSDPRTFLYGKGEFVLHPKLLNRDMQNTRQKNSR